MIYLDNGATSFRKPPGVYRAVERAMYTCANPGRGGYPAAMEASETVYACREAAAELFHCRPEQVALTTSCTHGLNIAIRSIVKPGGTGDRVRVRAQRRDPPPSCAGGGYPGGGAAAV